MVELESFPWAQRDTFHLNLPSLSSLRASGSSDSVSCWAGCLRDELSPPLLLLPVNQWGDDRRHQGCSVGLTSTLSFKPAHSSAHPRLETQLWEASSVTGSSGSWIWPFWNHTSICRPSGEQGWGRRSSEGFWQWATFNLLERTWAHPQCTFLRLYLFPVLCGSFRYRVYLLWVKKKVCLLRTKRDGVLFSACVWVAPVDTNRALCSWKNKLSSLMQTGAFSYLKNKHFFFFLHWVN